MSEHPNPSNRVVWFDIPVADLDRAAEFYAAVLAIAVHKEEAPGGAFGVLAHDNSVGGCLVVAPAQISASGGVLVYLNADGRLRAAVAELERRGGRVLEPIHAIGPHGFCAIALDSEGNRIALHSNRDA
ncbi:MAG: VOC family protein [Deltaproteobacteria bacterium]|nr:VOC family protein [Deltaproteobacteria bacterium]